MNERDNLIVKIEICNANTQKMNHTVRQYRAPDYKD